MDPRLHVKGSSTIFLLQFSRLLQFTVAIAFVSHR
jgi:hypothetical protein